MIRSRVLGLGIEGVLLVRAGRSREGTDLLMLALRLARANTSGMRGYLSRDLGVLNVIDTASYIADCIPNLPESELARLAPYFPPTRSEDPDGQRAIRVDFQREVLPLLADPKAWVRSEKPNEDPDEVLTNFAKSRDFDANQIVLDGYDAFATAREASALFGAAHRNANLSQPGRIPNGIARLQTLTSDLPRNTAAGRKGWAYLWRRFLSRTAMRKTPNAYGKLLLLSRFTDIAFATSGFDQRRVGEEAVRTLIALRRYRLRFGSSAPSLGALLKQGLLETLPVDPHAPSPSPLRYSAPAHKLWSVGIDGRDQGGSHSVDRLYKTP